MPLYRKLITTLAFATTLLASDTFADNSITVNQINSFGDNPGDLSASMYTPNAQASALVVLLHGCGQKAELLAKQTGLLAAAKQEQFALLLPQQSNSNNMQFCFNWFSSTDHKAGSGETASLMNMIAYAKQSSNTKTVYLVGLSAGGAMSSSMLAQYPETFSGVAIIAGVGYPCADSLVKALSCMKNGSSYDIDKLVSPITDLHNAKVDWPSIVIVTGTEDTIVSPKNSQQIFELWTNITEASNSVALTNLPEQISGKRSKTKNERFIELIEIKGLGHGWPINLESIYSGEAAPFVVETSLSMTDYLMDLWQLR